MKIYQLIIFMFIWVASLGMAYGATPLCSADNFILEVEMKYLEFNEEDKPYYDRQYRPFPENWSLAFPGLGKTRVKTSGKAHPQERHASLQLDFLSMDGKILTTQKLELNKFREGEQNYFETSSDLDLKLISFFKLANEGKVKVTAIFDELEVCYQSVEVLGTLEQDE